MSTIFEVVAIDKKTRKQVKQFYVRCRPELEGKGIEALLEAENRVDKLNEEETKDGEPLYDMKTCELSTAPVEFECDGIEMVN